MGIFPSSNCLKTSSSGTISINLGFSAIISSNSAWTSCSRNRCFRVASVNSFGNHRAVRTPARIVSSLENSTTTSLKLNLATVSTHGPTFRRNISSIIDSDFSAQQAFAKANPTDRLPSKYTALLPGHTFNRCP
uniref:(northern house mosquito) hypothetical protein n=1 Tax=Culex pipiens TaxID=7175 RepID=A0A8D8FJW6_CULPI